MVRTNPLTTRLMAGLLCSCVVVNTIPAGEPTPVSPTAVPIMDVQLGSQGTLIGRIVDRQGVLQPEMDVFIVPVRGQPVETKTDKLGRFIAAGLRGGEYRIVADQQPVPVRLWTHSAAPPSAGREALVVIGAAVRGQCNIAGCTGCGTCAPSGHFDGAFWHALRNPWIVGSLTAAAIAIPLAVDDDDAS